MQIDAQEVLRSRLNSYLNSSRLSMDQLAKKWHVSSAMLSQLRNNKRKAGVDLGLKILRETGADIEQRKDWLELRYLEDSDEVELVKKDFEQRKTEQDLQKFFCDLLENNPVLMDVFLDISLAESAGLDWSSIFKNYGEHGVDLLHTLLESGIIKKNKDKYVINEKNITHVTSEVSSFGIMKGIFENLKVQRMRDKFRGEFQYDITDVSPEAYEQLIELNKEYVMKTREIMENNERHRLAGGVRIVHQSIVSILKGTMCFALVLLFSSFKGSVAQEMTADNILKGGLRGGSSQSHVLNMRSFGPSLPTKFLRNFDRNFNLKSFYLIRRGFDSKEEAVQSAVDLNKSFEQGDLDEGLLKEIQASYPERCLSSGRLPRRTVDALKSGSIISQSFKVYKRYMNDGRPVFRVRVNYRAPCEKDRW